MPIESHSSAQAPDTIYSQQVYDTGQSGNTNIARSHSQIFPGSSFGTIDPGAYQQYLPSLVYTVSQDDSRVPPNIVFGLTLPFFYTYIIQEQKVGYITLVINYFALIEKTPLILFTSGTTREQPSPPTIPRNKPSISVVLR